MAPPSYARATASSTLKARLRSTESKGAESPQATLLPSPETSVEPGTPISSIQSSRKSLKRPSLLTPEERETIAYKRDLYPIRPEDPSRPCPLGTLPSELRCHIYSFLLPSPRYISDSWSMGIRHMQNRPPPLLQICRAIKIEVAYTYYTQTHFQFTVRNLDFDRVRGWVDSLPKEYKALLAKNKSLEVNIIPRVRNDYAYPPPNYLIDDYLEDHWKACQQFGNIYTVQGDRHKKHFLVFCRLAGWWTWCLKAPNTDLKWTYTFDISVLKHPPEPSYFGSGTSPRTFLYDHVTVLTKRCVYKAWKRGSNVKSMRRVAMEWLNALDAWYETWHQETGGNVLDKQKWDVQMKVIKKAVERW